MPGVLTDPGITPSIGNSGAGNGTVFQFATTGRYEVNYQTSYPSDGGVVLYQGPTVLGMGPIGYSMVGKLVSGSVTGTVIVQVTAGDFLSMNAAPGNTILLQPGTNSSTTNQGATTISFKKLT